jgi:two-component sensor histidine kinase
VEVAIDVAVPCGLILNELISNALKHAFPQGRRGEIKIRLQRVADGEVLLSVSDDGVGTSPGFDFEQSGALGLKTVQTLARQLHGSVAFTGQPGVTCQVRFQDQPAEAQRHNGGQNSAALPRQTD